MTNDTPLSEKVMNGTNHLPDDGMLWVAQESLKKDLKRLEKRSVVSIPNIKPKYVLWKDVIEIFGEELLK